MNRITRTLFAVALAAVMAFPALAAAKRDGDRRHEPRNPVVSYEFKGTVKAVEGQVVTVTVQRSNRHGRRFKGQDVQFDVTNARIKVKDRNGDGLRNLADVTAGDRAVVQSRMPKRLAEDAAQPFPAKKLIAKAPRPPEPDDDDEEAPAPPAP